MFLDDKLYNHFISQEINDLKDVYRVLNELLAICDEHKQANLPSLSNFHTTEPIVVKAELDRIFKSWNSFIEKLKKDNHYLAPLYEEYSYKNIWMKNDKLREIYLKLQRC